MVITPTPANGSVEGVGAAAAEDDRAESSDTPAIKHSTHYSNGHPPNLPKVEGVNGGAESTRKRLESTSLMTHPVHDEDLLDFHQHRLLPGFNKLDITYNLYAAVVSCNLH